MTDKEKVLNLYKDLGIELYEPRENVFSISRQQDRVITAHGAFLDYEFNEEGKLLYMGIWE